MKITVNYFVIRSPELKKFVCNSYHGTETKLLTAAQKFDTKADAEVALSEFISRLEQLALNRKANFTDEDQAERWYRADLKKAHSFKIFQAERIFELKDEVIV